MSDLDEFVSEADKNSKFVRFAEGEPVRGIFQGAELIDDSFNPGEQTIQYTLEIEKVKKTFNSKSVKLARLMKPIKVGEIVEIVKTGESFKTLWYVYSGAELTKGQ